MTDQRTDEGIRAVREIREKISLECGNDPLTLVEHLLAEQERYKDRLLVHQDHGPVDSRTGSSSGSPEES